MGTQLAEHGSAMFVGLHAGKYKKNVSPLVIYLVTYAKRISQMNTFIMWNIQRLYWISADHD